MHIKFPKFLAAKDAIVYHKDDDTYDICATVSVDEFWTEAHVTLSYDCYAHSLVVQADMIISEFKSLQTRSIQCENNKKSITTAYNKAVAELKAIYTEWVYTNIIDGGLTTPE